MGVSKRALNQTSSASITRDWLPSHNAILLALLLRDCRAVRSLRLALVRALGRLGGLALLLLLLPELALAVGFVELQVRGGEGDGGGFAAEHFGGGEGV